MGHAWNEVYRKEEGKWINVDRTFYIAGNYFDNEDFDNDHIKEILQGSGKKRLAKEIFANLFYI